MPIGTAAVIGGAAIGALASGVASWFSHKSASKGADTDLQAVRETNAMNQQLAREQNDWNRQMWEDTNEYNSTANQLARWKAAGLSPNAFAAVANPVAADTINSADLANQQAPQVGKFYAQEGQQISDNILQSSAQAQEYVTKMKALQLEERSLGIKEAELGLHRTETETFVNKANAEIDKLKADKLVSDENANLLKARVAEVQKNTDLMNEVLERTKEEREHLRLSNEYDRKTLDNRIRMTFKELQSIDAEIAQMVANKDLSYAEYDKAMEQLYYLYNYGEPKAQQELTLGEFHINAMKLENGRLEFDLNFDKEHKETSLYLDRGLKVIDALSGAATTVIAGQAARSMKGFRSASRMSRRGNSYRYNNYSNFYTPISTSTPTW